MEIAFKPSFIRQYKKLSQVLRDEADEKISLFQDPENHSVLKVHKLKGDLDGSLSFWVNYRYRIIFEWEIQGKSAVLMGIGTHEIYD